jgi:hypothetical protein
VSLHRLTSKSASKAKRRFVSGTVVGTIWRWVTEQQGH